MRANIPSQRILVVDDEPRVRYAMRILLTFDGHRVEVVDGGEAALQSLTQGAFDFVFTDFNMPGMSGEELAVAIKQTAPQQVIVLVTAYWDGVNRSQKDRLPFDFVLTKPFDIATLRDVLRRATTNRDK